MATSPGKLTIARHLRLEDAALEDVASLDGGKLIDRRSTAIKRRRIQPDGVAKLAARDGGASTPRKRSRPAWAGGSSRHSISGAGAPAAPARRSRGNRCDARRAS